MSTREREDSIEITEQRMALAKYDSRFWTKFKNDAIESYSKITAKSRGTLSSIQGLVCKYVGLSISFQGLVKTAAVCVSLSSQSVHVDGSSASSIVFVKVRTPPSM
jgi:hypothetical protein